MKNKLPMKLSGGVEVMSLSAAGTGGAGRVRMRLPIAADGIRADAKLAARMKRASLWYDVNVPSQQKNDNFNYDNIGDVLPQDGDFITVPFRALSQRVIPGHWLDFTREGVLENAVGMLAGQTVYPNHDFTDINNALGAVASASWDAEDVAGKGMPGINAEYKIDALMNPRIARLLLMKPPGIHSTSLTILFDFEFSHPDLVEEGKFWMLLGEEVSGEIVRLIVTEIHDFWEASLVFQGADSFAKQYDDGQGDTDFAEMSAKGGEGDEPEPPNSIEEKTMKLTAEKKAQLGIEFDGEDVPETEILKAAETLAEKHATLSAGLPDNVEELKAQAKAGHELVEKLRAKVLADAKLAELGAEDGELAEVIESDIKSASLERLNSLESYFGEKIAAKFPKGGKSSQEDSDEIDAAAGGAELVADTEAEDRTAGLL